MIRLKILAFALLFIAVNASAQGVEQSDDARKIEWRQKIGMDYSMPDFNTSKLNGKIIGNRLAHILMVLSENVEDLLYKEMISAIVVEQHDELRYLDIKRLKVTNVSKRGDVISIMMKIGFADNSLKAKSAKLKLKFVKGVSDSPRTNELFAYVSRYVRD